MIQGKTKYKKLVDQAAQIINDDKRPREQKLREICELLAQEVDVFDWMGFYLADPESDRELILGPYVGEATDHTRIPYGKGICGQSAEMNKTFVVQDVSQADNYIACSIDVKSEIVIPIRKNGDFVAQIDIDSHQKNAITEDHRKLLEQICDHAEKLF